jgi:UDP-N-acetylmuramyl pentapeptide phosphotransferase/UDP-N-acetylglucosamine-1-phosphate transferase
MDGRECNGGVWRHCPNAGGPGIPATYNAAVRHLLLSFGVSAAATLWIVHQARVRGGVTLDDNFSQPQKMHTHPVPRIGGLAIVLGLLATALVMHASMGATSAGVALLLLACALPAFLVGFVHDLFDNITPRGRLVATAASAGLAFYLLDIAIRVTAIPGLDWVVGFGLGALVVTVFTVSGIANAINIIDGLNGLAAMCVAIMLGAIAYVAFMVGDVLVGTLALAGIGAVLGFFIWNFPAGLVFLGDGGSYFLGFWLAEVAILLLVRNPEVSPIFPLLVCIYPVFETLFSIYRRFWLRSAPLSMPDGIHLHSLLYRRLMRWAVGKSGARALTRRNSMTSPFLWLLCSASVVPAVLFWDNTTVIALFLALFGLSYVLLYQRIVRFKSPGWLRRFTPSSRPMPLLPGDNPKT